MHGEESKRTFPQEVRSAASRLTGQGKQIEIKFDKENNWESVWAWQEAEKYLISLLLVESQKGDCLHARECSDSHVEINHLWSKICD